MTDWTQVLISAAGLISAIIVTAQIAVKALAKSQEKMSQSIHTILTASQVDEAIFRASIVSTQEKIAVTLENHLITIYKAQQVLIASNEANTKVLEQIRDKLLDAILQKVPNAIPAVTQDDKPKS